MHLHLTICVNSVIQNADVHNVSLCHKTLINTIQYIKIPVYIQHVSVRKLPFSGKSLKKANEKVEFASYLMRITITARNENMSVTKPRFY